MYEMAMVGAAFLVALSMLFNQRYQKLQGDLPGTAMRFSLWTSLIGAVVPVITQGMRLEFTWFSLLFAAWGTINGLLYNVCSLRALETANLSVFTTFAMLGGVLVPFAGGILLWKEPLTWQKAVCCLLLTVSILMDVRLPKRSEARQRSPMPYYFAVFLLNGLGGLINKLHQSFPDLAVDSGSYSAWARLVAVAISAVCLLARRQPLLPSLPERRGACRVWVVLAMCAVLSLVGNWILLVALLHVDASISYTLTCGCTMVFSTLLSAVRRELLERRQYVAVAVALVGLLCLAL